MAALSASGVGKLVKLLRANGDQEVAQLASMIYQRWRAMAKLSTRPLRIAQ